MLLINIINEKIIKRLIDYKVTININITTDENWNSLQ